MRAPDRGIVLNPYDSKWNLVQRGTPPSTRSLSCGPMISTGYSAEEPPRNSACEKTNGQPVEKKANDYTFVDVDEDG